MVADLLITHMHMDDYAKKVKKFKVKDQKIIAIEP